MSPSPEPTYTVWQCPNDGVNVTLTVENSSGATASLKPVHTGSDLACVIELMERMDATSLLELERTHLPRVKHMRRVELVPAFTPAVPVVTLFDDCDESEADDTETYRAGGD